MAWRDDDSFEVPVRVCLVEEDTATVPASVFCIVESLVGAGEERTCYFAGDRLGEADANSKPQPGAWDRRKFTYRLLDSGGDVEGVGTRSVGKDQEKFIAAEAAEEVMDAEMS
jgi:hypothetical protein